MKIFNLLTISKKKDADFREDSDWKNSYSRG